MSVDKLVDSTQLDADLTFVANAIRTKGGTSASLAFPAGFISAVEAIETGGENRDDLCDPLDVDFVDYDGRLLYSYSAEDFLSLTELPENPSNSGLIAQGWNWALADAKEYVAKYGALVIGQNYTTDNGRTKIYITIPSYFSKSIQIYIDRYSGSDVSYIIYWGDGSSTNSTTAYSQSHTYTDAGKYIIEIQVNSGSVYLGYWGSNHKIVANNYRQQMFVDKVEIGNGVTGLCRNTFDSLDNCKSISIPNTVINVETGSDYAVFNCYSLKGIVLPSGFTGKNIRIFGNGAHHLYNLKYIALPKSFTLGKFNANYLRSLRKLTIYSYTNPNLDVYGYDCTSMTHFIVPGTYTTITTDRCRSSLIQKLWIPETVTSISATAFVYNGSLTEVHLLPTTPPTLSNVNAFGSGPANRVYYVPYSEDHSILEAYQTATNWSTYASQMQEEPQ